MTSSGPAIAHFRPAKRRVISGVHLSALKLDDTILAAHWGYVVGGRFYYLMPSFEGGDWNRYSADRLLIEHLLEWSFERGLEAFDFTVGDEDYKSEFCDLTIPLYSAIMLVSVSGRIYANVFAAKMRLQKTRAWPILRRHLLGARIALQKTNLAAHVNPA